LDPSATQAKIPPRLIAAKDLPNTHETLCVTANAIAKLYRDCAEAQICGGPMLRCGWYRHLEQHSARKLSRGAQLRAEGVFVQPDLR
jgi:hypothetical protein